MIRLSVSDRLGELPTPVRSSGTWATPWRMAWPAERFMTSTPAIVTLPFVAARMPGDDLGQLRLAVAGHGRDAHDLAGPDVEGGVLRAGTPRSPSA